ncbi:hypothetical protein HPB47_001522 [Ixodes persulcatus]|uniref:Uncharacterized protein n=1 Tax=Ixodes persulcatus TaxID=34615 RepID=A0AC60PQK4_IXOPE|nr:hypothetical protein HPB47_001522 [Ixodes persulcatus]
MAEDENIPFSFQADGWVENPPQCANLSQDEVWRYLSSKSDSVRHGNRRWAFKEEGAVSAQALASEIVYERSEDATALASPKLTDRDRLNRTPRPKGSGAARTGTKVHGKQRDNKAEGGWPAALFLWPPAEARVFDEEDYGDHCTGLGLSAEPDC